MTTLGTGSEGNTPLSPEELADLIPSLATKEELNEWERENNLQARAWAIEDRTSPADIPSDEYVRNLHKRMFDQTWKWAGQYRRTEKNIGVPVYEIRERFVALCGGVVLRATSAMDAVRVLGEKPHAVLLGRRVARCRRQRPCARRVPRGAGRRVHIPRCRPRDFPELADLQRAVPAVDRLP